MSIPVNRLKLLAFMFGAGIAGLAGCLFAAVLTAVTPGNFALPILITIYAVVILGGIGSLTGVVIGAVVINVSFQLLAPENPQTNARLLFYGTIVLLLVFAVRPLVAAGGGGRRRARVRLRRARGRSRIARIVDRPVQWSRAAGWRARSPTG